MVSQIAMNVIFQESINKYTPAQNN